MPPPDLRHSRDDLPELGGSRRGRGRARLRRPGERRRVHVRLEAAHASRAIVPEEDLEGVGSRRQVDRPVPGQEDGRVLLGPPEGLPVHVGTKLVLQDLRHRLEEPAADLKQHRCLELGLLAPLCRQVAGAGPDGEPQGRAPIGRRDEARAHLHREIGWRLEEQGAVEGGGSLLVGEPVVGPVLVVAPGGTDVGSGPAHRDLQLAEASPLVGVAGSVPEDVVMGGLVHDTLEHLTHVVGVAHRLSAGVAGQRDQAIRGLSPGLGETESGRTARELWPKLFDWLRGVEAPGVEGEDTHPVPEGCRRHLLQERGVVGLDPQARPVDEDHLLAGQGSHPPDEVDVAQQREAPGEHDLAVDALYCYVAGGAAVRRSNQLPLEPDEGRGDPGVPPQGGGQDLPPKDEVVLQVQGRVHHRWPGLAPEGLVDHPVEGGQEQVAAVGVGQAPQGDEETFGEVPEEAAQGTRHSGELHGVPELRGDVQPRGLGGWGVDRTGGGRLAWVREGVLSSRSGHVLDLLDLLTLAVLLEDEVFGSQVRHRGAVVAGDPNLDLDELHPGGEGGRLLGGRGAQAKEEGERGRDDGPHPGPSGASAPRVAPGGDTASTGGDRGRLSARGVR